MSKLSKLHANGMVWVRARAAAVKGKYKQTHGARGSAKIGAPWWKKDIKELLVDINSQRLRIDSAVTLQSIADISCWAMRYRVAALILVFVLGVLLSTMSISTDALNEIDAKNVERELLKNRYLRYAEQVDMLSVYRIQTETIHERFGELLDAIPAALESVHVLSQLNKAAKDSGLQLEFFKPLGEEVHAYYVVLPIEIRLRGDYNAIAKFLELVSRMQHLVTVDVVMLPSATHVNQIVLASLLKAYRYKDLPKKPDGKVSRDAR
ncbi:MAG: type 4a pilus biogenesis protein PilO [Fluviibacter sp.]